MDHSRHDERENAAYAVSDEGEEVAKMRHGDSHPSNHNDGDASDGKRVPADDSTLQHLVHRVHHHGEGEEQAHAQRELDDGGLPAISEVQRDDIPGQFSKCEVTESGKRRVHETYASHSQSQSLAELRSVLHVALQRENEAKSLERIDCHPDDEREGSEPREGVHITDSSISEHDDVRAHHDGHS
ncbi:hypothetical protein Mapa_012015 [Marchantia paleacea]|nr:hypothetical protein Mapa_012015 [Marchantia paleacea]